MRVTCPTHRKLLPSCKSSAPSSQQQPLTAAASVFTDWSHSGDEHAAAYTRAGLPHWAAQCLSEPGSPIEAASQSAGPASQAAPAPVLADRPSAVVQATISDVLLTLPHDQDFGRAERFVELWSKAFGQVEYLHQCFTACSCLDVSYIHCCTLLHNQSLVLLHHQYFMLLHHQTAFQGAMLKLVVLDICGTSVDLFYKWHADLICALCFLMFSLPQHEIAMCTACMAMVGILAMGSALWR